MEHHLGQDGGNLECAKSFLSRASSATSGVEGFYAADGTQLSHMFLLRPEGPVVIAEMFLFLKVSI